MGYKRKDLQILGGGFNLLPPSDKVPQTDYLLAQNWRVDRLGRLVSRYGYQQKFAIAGAGLAHSAGIHGGINGDYYVGCNASVANPTPSSLYWNLNPSAIATGFDGGRIGFAAMNGWMYAMNRGKQVRHQASLGAGTSQSWNLEQPGNSPTAASAADPVPDPSVTYNYSLQGDPSYIHSLTINGVTYQFAENGYGADQVPLLISLLAGHDGNATVTYSGSGTAVTITPSVANTLVQVSGSDGNPAKNLANGTVTSLPNGTYTLYVTFETADETLESNPSPSSAAVTLSSQSCRLTNIPVSSDARVAKRNIYAIGGTLASPYLVATIGDNTTTSWTFSWSDLDATNAGIVMPTNNDPPPAAAGLIGPHFGRLFGWSTAANPNRLFYTEPDQPQYWPGSRDPSVGNFVDVGAEGEAIVWCTIHGNSLVIYKERSIWVLVGDPDPTSGGYLQKVRDGLGLDNAFALTEAGTADYFVAAGSLYRFDGDNANDGFSAAIQPLFTAGSTNAGELTPPGSIQPGSQFNVNATAKYAVSLGYALGKLYVSYAEQGTGTSYCLLVYHEESRRWFYHRNSIAGVTGIFGFLFDGAQMVALSGSAGGAAIGENLDDYRVWATTDPGGAPIHLVYQSHYEDAGAPDLEKVWLEIAIDCETLSAFDVVNVAVGIDAGATVSALSSVTGPGRQLVTFPLAKSTLSGAIVTKDPADLQQVDVLAKNLSVLLSVAATDQVIIHNVYLYYYCEARLAMAVASIPTDLGLGKVKQCKELEVDVDAQGYPVMAIVSSDMPGNALAERETLAVANSNGRALVRIPFGVVEEGYIWRLALATTQGQFRLYGARMLMRPIGTYVEAYESTAGFVWDSQELTFDSGITHIPRGYAIALASLPIKRAREIRLELETFGGDVTLKLLSDLPGNQQDVRFTATVNTGTAGRRFFTVPLPAGTNAPIEGRMFRIQLSGGAAYRLYSAAVEILAVGVYLEAYEAAGGAVYDSREVDLGTPAVKEVRELELDIETSGTVAVKLLGDVVASYLTTASTSGRQKVLIPLTLSAGAEQFFEARLARLILSGSSAFRLYGARVLARAFGVYLTADEASGGALWDTTDIDLGSQTVKQLRELELDLWAYGDYTVTVYTDLPGNAMAARVTRAMGQTNGRTKVQIPLPQGAVPDNYIFGRLARVTVTSASAIKLFGARIDARPVGLYVETYEAQAGAVWDSTPTDLGSPNDKSFDQVRIEMDTDGVAQVTIYTDLPGEAFAPRWSANLTPGPTGRHWATVPLPDGIEGRSIRLVVSSAAGFRIYKAQVRHFRVGRYLCAATPSGNDQFRSLEFDFQSERQKMYKLIEVDLRADGVVNMDVITDQGDLLAARYSPTIATPNGRQALQIALPPGLRGRLFRLRFASSNQARIYRLRVWARPLNEPQAAWSWQDYPLEESDLLPAWADLAVPETPAEFTWADLPVAPTKPEWAWAPLPVNPTDAQWMWAKVLSVEETPDTWTWVDVPMGLES